MMASLPTIVTKQGLQPQAPADLLSQLIAGATALSPGLTTDLPGTLIEDISSTDVFAISQCDAARVELVNSLTPYGANEFLLTQLGNIYGQTLGESTNASVYCLFTGTVGFVIPIGFTVSDGTHQYVVKDGGVVQSSGTVTLYCVANTTGTWAIPAGTVTSLITSVPSTVSLTVTNTIAGTPSTGTQTYESFRGQVLQAGIAPSIGALSYLKSKLAAVSGVIPRLISVNQIGANFQIIVGGGDPYAVAYAIFTALFDYDNLVGSNQILISGITKANPGVVNTFPIVHGLTTGQFITISGVLGMTQVNNITAPEYQVIVLSPYTFTLTRSSVPVDTSGYGAYVSGGIVTPDIGIAFNQRISINNFPNTYTIQFVTPPLQSLGVLCTWQTTNLNFTSQAAVAQLAQQPIIDYVNNLPGGYAVNVLELQAIFSNAVSSVLPAQFISQIAFTFTINGVAATPVNNMLQGDPQGYFSASTSTVSIVQGP